jgi:hypothetical protein
MCSAGRPVPCVSIEIPDPAVVASPGASAPSSFPLSARRVERPFLFCPKPTSQRRDKHLHGKDSQQQLEKLLQPLAPQPPSDPTPDLGAHEHSEGGRDGNLRIYVSSRVNDRVLRRLRLS